MAVITAVDFEDFFASRKSARKADRAHHGLGPGRNEPGFFHGRKKGADGAGKFDLIGGRGPKTCPPFERTAKFADQTGGRVTENERAPGSAEIKVALSFFIPNKRALAFADENGIASDGAEGPHRGINTGGNKLPGDAVESGAIRLQLLHTVA